MRKYIQKQILGIVPSVWEGVKYAKSGKHKNDAEKVLGDCYATILTIDKTLEAALSAERYAEYKELFDYLGQLLEALNACIASGENFSEISREIKDNLDLFERELKAEKEVRLEVVFMPYKASMWDSLESIWRAADADESCDAYVVPIPYYDRNPDQSFGKMHYEGYDYPKDVPIVNYEAYSLEKRKPDIVYIHNPYDEFNKVTSVDPKFYSHEIKKHTDMLVYVPYFVVSDDVPEHFCVTSGCIYSDKVIVQSEAIRETYINTYIKSNISTAKQLNEKFAALGSPKFDCVVNEKSEVYVLPEKWKRIIGQKKIILYNTSVSAILNGNTQYLEKIQSVLNFFSKHKEVVLWWRPHPLSEAVYDSMRHVLISSYLNLIEQYKESGLGIFDDTPDLHRAIACSNAYYGDRSSLVALYQLTGKPIMLQSTDICQYNSGIDNIAFESVYDDGEYIWFSAMNFNGLFKASKETYIPQFVGFFPGERYSGARLYSDVIVHNGKLYFAPFYARKIAIYDLKTGLFDTIEYNCENHLIPRASFYSVVCANQTLFFIPYGNLAIVCYNTVSGKITYQSEWASMVKSSKYYDEQIGFFRRGVVVGEKIFLPCLCTNKMVVLDIYSFKSEIIDVTQNDWSFHGICVNNEKLWLAPYKGQVVCMDIKTRRFTEIKLSCPEEEGTFIDICNVNSKIRLFPYHADEAIEIDTISSSQYVAEKLEKSISKGGYDGHYIFGNNIGNTIYSYDLQAEQFVVYNTETSEANRYDMKLSLYDAKLISDKTIYDFLDETNIEDQSDSNNFIEGNITVSNLFDLLSTIHDKDKSDAAEQARAEVRKRTISNSDGTAGKKIHNYIKSEVLSL